MQKKPRVDKRKNIGKVAEVLAKNPNKTWREVAKEAWIPHRTTANAIKELAQTGTKDPTIAYIVGSSKDRLKKVQAVFDRYLDESIEKVKLERGDLWLIKDIAKDDLQRITVLWWTITDAEWWLRDLSNLSILELESQRRLLLGE
jgi:hypothetical protein